MGEDEKFKEGSLHFRQEERKEANTGRSLPAHQRPKSRHSATSIAGMAFSLTRFSKPNSPPIYQIYHVSRPFWKDFVPLEPSAWTTSTDLKDYDGSDPSLPVLVSVKGHVFDVSESEAYRKGQGYACLAGRDCSRSLAIMSLRPEDVTSNIGTAPVEMTCVYLSLPVRDACGSCE